MRGLFEPYVKLFAMFWYTPWKYFFIALALWPLVFRVQISRSHGANRKRYMLMDGLGVMSVLFITSAWILVLSLGWDTSAGFIFGILSGIVALLSALRMWRLWEALRRLRTKARG